MNRDAVANRLASAIHDIKNGLGLIVDGSDTLVQRWPPHQADDRELLLRIQRTSHQLRDQMAQVLTLYRLDTDHYLANIDAYPVVELLEDLCVHNEALLGSRELVARIKCDAELTGFLDRELTLAALNNGLGNAARYADSTITLSASRSGDDLVISIRDDGAGLDPAGAAAPGTTAIDLQSGNTGLGLYFAQRAAQAQARGKRHGSVSLNGAPGGGAVFELRLPQ